MQNNNDLTGKKPQRERERDGLKFKQQPCMHAVMWSSADAEQNDNTCQYHPKDNVHREHTASGTIISEEHTYKTLV